MILRAHAKINLSLEVVGTRPDGFHELRTVFQSLALHDTLRFAEAAEGMAVSCSAPGVPLDERNLVWKAARMVWDAAGRGGEPRGRVRITKRIPAQGGLGGGSADGAAAIVGWDRLWRTDLSAGRLRELARALGADVPFFLHGGTALGIERGDVIRPLDDGPARWVVLVFPPFGVSTPMAFGWWDEDHGQPVAQYVSAVAGVTGLPAASLPPHTGLPAVRNDLEAPVARRHPELANIRRALEQTGAEAAAMTGSGSTVFGLFGTRRAALAASDRLAGAGWTARVTRTCTRSQAGLLEHAGLV